MKYAVIIDSYPKNSDQKDRLIGTLKKFRSIGIDVLLSSHNSCSSEIIENSKYFLYEEKNEYYFLDSHILNENLSQIKDPTYSKYTYIGDSIFYDNLVVTGWSVAITSQLFNSIKFLYGKGYEYAFYMVDDFNFPDDFEEKIKSILEKSKGRRNYFIRNQSIFSSWFAGFFFGFTRDQKLMDKIPNVDFSSNIVYQKYFPNYCGEDVVNEIWLNDDNYIEDHSELDNIFGRKNWNLDSSVIKPGSSTLHNETSSSIYINSSKEEYRLMLYLNSNSFYDSVIMNIRLIDSNNNILYNTKNELLRGWFFVDSLTDIFSKNEKIIFEKEVIGYSRVINYFKDSIVMDKKDMDSYKRLKHFNHT